MLVPGCGTAGDAAFLDRQGWQTTAVDVSPVAIDLAREAVGRAWRGTLLCADWFTFEFPEVFDVVYERAFLCALPRRLWPAYAERMIGLLRSEGLLVGYFFFSARPEGPPFGLRRGDLERLLTPGFVLLEDEPVSDSLPVFAGGERWQVWQRA